MSERKHSPAPWHARQDNAHEWQVVHWNEAQNPDLDAPYWIICDVLKDSADGDDAYLIAAAPEMLEALDMQVRNCPLCKGTGKAVHAVEFLTGSNEKRDCEWCAKGRAALSKARGETP